MLFNSISFAIFLSFVFFFYWVVSVRNIKLQNIILLLSSVFFYGYWSWKFLFILFFSISLDFVAGILIFKQQNLSKRKYMLIGCVSINIGVLFFLKYYNFFIQSFSEALTLVNIRIDPWVLTLVLPLGISFYTFHGLSYVIDIYKQKIEPEYSFINYSLFVCFFPLLVAGPIERATNLLIQIRNQRRFDYTTVVDGLRQILWGLFKKVVIADQCSQFVNPVFEDSAVYSASNHVLAAFLFAIQIYCDFSGYSDIAIGTAKLFGIKLLRNFNYPYFSRDIAEFWRRWHISLSTWFRDYIYIPLGGSHGSTWIRIRNTVLIFLISGFWHGANWTFIIWGFLHALYIMPLIIFKKNRSNLDIVAKGRCLPSLKEIILIFFTFGLTVIAWVFFRSTSIKAAFHFLLETVSMSVFTTPEIPVKLLFLLFLIGILIIVEWVGRENEHPISGIWLRLKTPLRWSLYIILISLITIFLNPDHKFIYFQF